MKSMDALIRLARFQVEGLQKQMAGLDAARADLEAKVVQLDESVPEEQVAANASRDGFVAYGSYAQAVIKRKQNLRASIAEVDQQADKLREELEAAFQELKKYELMEERRVAQRLAAVKKREQDQLDELAQTRLARAG